MIAKEVVGVFVRFCAASAVFLVPRDHAVDSAPGECSRLFALKMLPLRHSSGNRVTMLFDGTTEMTSPYIENGMRLDGIDFITSMHMAYTL
jgi:hypothetical protein